MAKINITESELKNIINESVRKFLNELDWKTWQNAAKKTKNTDRKNAFMSKAQDEFNKNFGHNASDDSFGSYTKMDKNGNLRHVNNYVGGAKTDEKLANKPAEVLSKILDGKVKKYFADSTLECQPFLMDDSKTVGQLLKEKNVKIVKFVRYHVGEGIEKRQDDFASEVMSQIQ
jgi:translation elongation factor Ts